jgi:uncharacterized protein (UPF0332 family)
MQLSENVKSLCKYRIESAKEDLQTAKVDYDNGLYKGAINRAYYCIFHSIRAVNILDGFDASKHSSVIAHFNQIYVHSGLFDKAIYKIIDSSYRIREKCDYSDFYIATKDEAEKQIKEAETFVGIVEKFVNEKIEI